MPLDRIPAQKRTPVALRAHITDTLETDFYHLPWNRQLLRAVEGLANQWETELLPAVILLPARTDTAWWRRVAGYPVCLIQGRLRFEGHNSSAPMPSAVFYLGPLSAKTFAKAMTPWGDTYLREPAHAS